MFRAGPCFTQSRRRTLVTTLRPGRMNSRVIDPMLATLGLPPNRFADFAVEAKYDGQRGLATVDGDQVTLLSRNSAAHPRFPKPLRASLITRDGTTPNWSAPSTTVTSAWCCGIHLVFVGVSIPVCAPEFHQFTRGI